MNSSHPSEQGSVADRERGGLFRNVLTACLGQAGVIVFGLCAMALTTRLLGPEGYGTLTVFFMALGVTTQVLMGWPNSAIVRFGREELRERGGIRGTFWARVDLYVLCAAVLVVLVCSFRRDLRAYLGLGARGPWLLLAYALVLTAVEMFGVVHQSLGRFRSMATLNALPKLFNCLLLAALYFVVTDRAGPSSVLTLHVVSLLCVFGGAVILAARTPPGWPRFEPARIARMASYAWPIMIAGLGGVLVDWIDTAVINHYRPREDVGVYGVAYQVVLALGGIRAAILSVIWPLVISLKVEQRHETLRWYLDDFLPGGVILLGCLLAVVGIAAEAIPWVFGGEFARSALLSQALVAGFAFAGLGAMIVNVPNAYDRVKWVACTSILIALINLGGDLLLVPRMGPMGAAISTGIAFAAGSLLTVFVVNSIAEVRGPRSRYRLLTPLGLLPAIAVPVLAVSIDRLSVRLAAYAGMAIVWCAFVRSVGWIDRSALARLEKVGLPSPALSAIRGVYVMLSRKRAVH